MLTCDLAFGRNNKHVENLLSFLESLRSPLWYVYNLSYGWNNNYCAHAKLVTLASICFRLNL
jgi:hypothetical protein